MNDFEPVDINFVINSPEVKADAAEVKAEITGVAVTAETVAEKTGKKIEAAVSKSTKKVKEETEKAAQETQKLNDELDQSAAALGRQGAAANTAKAQWNGLGNSINQISRELPAFTYSAQTGFMAISNNIPTLVDEIGRLKAANVAAAASGAATIPVWKAVGAAIFSWGTALSLIITLVTVFGKEIGAWITGLFKTSDAMDQVKRSQDAMNEAFKGSQVKGAIEEIISLKTNLDLASKGLIDQKTVIDQYNESVGKAASEAKTLADVEQGMVDNADKYVQATLYKAAALAAQEEIAKEMVELAKEQHRIEEELAKAPEETARASTYSAARSSAFGAPMISDRDIAIAKERDLAKAQKENIKLQEDKLKLGTKLVQNLKEQSLATGLDVFSDESEFNKITGDIKKLNEQYANAGLKQAEKEIQTVKDKYAKLRAEADKFNADPRNKARLIDVSGMDAAEQKAIEAIRAKHQKTSTGKEAKEHQQLLDKIATLDAEYARKSFTKDEEELQALRDKFAKVRQLVERFNADPKNKAQRIDLTGLGDIENKAVGDLKFRQETAVMAKEMAEQKRIFQEFEVYKVQFGETKAKERFGKELKGYESYLDYLKDLKDRADLEADTASATGSGGGPQIERVALVDKEADAEVMRAEKKYQDLLAANQTFQDIMLKRTEEFNANYEKLLAGGRTDEAAVYKERFEAEDKALNLAQLKKTEAYKALYSNIRNLTVRNVKTLIAAMDEEVAKTELTAEQIEAIEKRKMELKRQLYGQIVQIAGALGTLGQSLQELGTSVGSSGLEQIGGLMAGLASGVGDLMTALDKDASSADKIAAGINGIVKMVDMLAGAAKRRRDAEEEYYRSVIGFQTDYNLSLNEQIRLQSKLQESVFLPDYEGRMKDGLSALKDANQQYQDSLDALSGGKAKTGQKNAIDWGNVGKGAASGAALGATIGSVVPVIGNVIGGVVGGIAGALAGLFGGKKKKDTYVPLLEEYDMLIERGEDGVERLNRGLAETLIANNLVDESTKQLLEDVMKWEDAIAEAREQIQGVVKDLVGSMGGEMRNALVQAFRDGEDAALAMGKTVEKVLEDMVAQIVFNKIFSDAFKQLEDEMVASQDVGGDGNWVDDFQRFFQASKGLGEEFNQALKDAQAQAAANGLNIFQPTGGAEPKKQGLTGGIERLTEQTGTELTGLFRGYYDLTKRQLQLLDSWYVNEQKHYENSLNSYRTLVMIEQNTGETVERLDEAILELKNITRNTKGGQSGYDLGEGP
jgi:hypothetical protein